MKNPFLLLDPVSSPTSTATNFLRRRLLSPKQKQKQQKGKRKRNKRKSQPLGLPPPPLDVEEEDSEQQQQPYEDAAAERNVSESTNSSSNSGGSGSSCSMVTATSSQNRLHLVLARRTPDEVRDLYQEVHKNKDASHVCVYTDSPLTFRGSLSKRQTSELLTQVVAKQCTRMTTLQLDFSSEFGPSTTTTITTTANGTTNHECAFYLKIKLVSRILERAPQLEQLVLKDVALKGNHQDVLELKRRLKTHTCLKNVELKWCMEVVVPTTNEDDHNCNVLPGFLEGLVECPTLQEITLLASCGGAAKLPLEVLATSKSIQKLKVALEQRHNVWQSLADRQREQQTLLTLMQNLKYNQVITDLTIYAQHWKEQESVQAVIDWIDCSNNNSTALVRVDLIDYGYGNDQPEQMVELAKAMQNNPRLEHLKLYTKKRSSSTSNTNNETAASGEGDVVPPLSRVYQAMLECAQHNTVLQSLEVSHCNVHINSTLTTTNNDRVSTSELNSDTSSSSSSSTSCSSSNYHEEKRLVQFYVQANRDGIRQRFLKQHHEVSNEEWVDFLERNRHKADTPLIFYLLQANPYLLLSRHTHVCH